MDIKTEDYLRTLKYLNTSITKVKTSIEDELAAINLKIADLKEERLLSLTRASAVKVNDRFMLFNIMVYVKHIKLNYTGEGLTFSMNKVNKDGTNGDTCFNQYYTLSHLSYCKKIREN